MVPFDGGGEREGGQSDELNMKNMYHTLSSNLQKKKRKEGRKIDRSMRCRNWHTFSVKVQIVNILGFSSQTVTVEIARLWSGSMKAAAGTNEHD